ncbi:vacuolar protein sorting-associated protein 11 [Anaeramoeba flamelloides]|uniref:Vacuolar protein sorting-associated protein 11 n=1 Tax=Anaeramoeba flamelloides TaxID=1746091 RepID=A0AAV7Y3P0_9EUKA|nr:vacuolar protein sorting-associated protein 11 [Anaeramoeba flamelloides]
MRYLVKNETDNKPNKELENKEIISVTTGRGHFIVGQKNGKIAILNSKFQIVTEFKAFRMGVILVNQLKRHDILVALGRDTKRNYILKFYNTKTIEIKQSLKPIKDLVVSHREVSKSPVAHLTVLETLKHIAIAFQNGAVLLVSGDLTNQKAKPKFSIIRNKNEDPLVGLLFRQKQLGGTNARVLFYVTKKTVGYWQINIKGEIREEKLEQNLEDPPTCCVITDRHELAIAIKNYVNIFTHEGRGPLIEFNNETLNLVQFRSYLVVLSKYQRRTNLTIYDINNQHIAFNSMFPTEEVKIVSEWGNIIVLSQNNSIYKIEGKSLQTKLEILFKKNLYDIAINIARAHKYNQNAIVDMFRKYGDHLCEKGDYPRAIQQYMNTIGTLEPSYVIRKFLEAQRIPNLILYLEELHDQEIANTEHTTLLLNCYTKLKNEDKLREFIRKQDKKFEVHPTIRVLRRAEYFVHALYLAKKYKEHDFCVKLLIEDLKQYDDALRYIQNLPVGNIIKILKEYGNTLVNHLPKETTQLLMDLVIDQSENEKKQKGISKTKRLFNQDQSESKIIPFEDLESDDDENKKNDNDNGFDNENNDDIQIYKEDDDDDIDDFDGEDDFDQKKKVVNERDLNVDEFETENREALYSGMSKKGKVINPNLRPTKKFNRGNENDVVKPEKFIHFFVEKSEWLIIFLENVIKAIPTSSKFIYNTLLELYLREESEIDPKEFLLQYKEFNNKNNEIEKFLKSQKNEHLKENKKEEEKKREDEKEKKEKEKEKLDEKGNENENENENEKGNEKEKEKENENEKEKEKEKEKEIEIENENEIQKEKEEENKSESNQIDHEKLKKIIRKQRLKESIRLLKDKQSNYDREHALILVQMHDYREGITYMLDKLGHYHEIVQHYMEIHNYEKVVSSCKKYGDDQPNIWMQVLNYFACIDKDVSEYIKQILESVKETNNLPPLLVLNILSKTEYVNLSTVRDYLIDTLETGSSFIEKEEKLVEEMQKKTKNTRKKLKKLKRRAKVFQLSKCSVCGNSLELPSVHFLCGHSVHASCIGNDDECPLCCELIHSSLEKKIGLQLDKEQQDSFFHHLETSEDGFTKIAEYFGRGLFSTLKVSESHKDRIKTYKSMN